MRNEKCLAVHSFVLCVRTILCENLFSIFFAFFSIRRMFFWLVGPLHNWFFTMSLLRRCVSVCSSTCFLLIIHTQTQTLKTCRHIVCWFTYTWRPHMKMKQFKYKNQNQYSKWFTILIFNFLRLENKQNVDNSFSTTKAKPKKTEEIFFSLVVHNVGRERERIFFSFLDLVPMNGVPSVQWNVYESTVWITSHSRSEWAK